VKRPQLEKQVAEAQQRADAEPTKMWPEAKGRLDEQFAQAAAQRKSTVPADAAPGAPSLKDRLLASLQGGLDSTKKFVGEHQMATGIAAGVAGGAGLTAAALALKRKLEAKKKPVRRVAVA